MRTKPTTARFSRRLTTSGERSWTGCRDHQTETCDADIPRVIVQVTTQPAPEQDIDALNGIHAALLPYGSVSASTCWTPAVSPRTSSIMPPSTGASPWSVRLDPRGDRGHPGFAKDDFRIDWENRTLACPHGVTSPLWKPTHTDGHARFSVPFPRKACRECGDRLMCTGNVDGKGHHLTLLPQPVQEIQTRARAEQKAEAWQRRYAMRALRSHRLRNRPRPRTTPLPLPRVREDARPAHPHHRRHQPRPAQHLLPTGHNGARPRPPRQPLPTDPVVNIVGTTGFESAAPCPRRVTGLWPPWRARSGGEY